MKTINFGIVGTGTIAHRFANAIKNVPGAALTGVASRQEKTARAFAEEFCIPNAFTGYENMAKSESIDCAYIAVPHGCHAECAIQQMNGGKAVICEKPMAVNANEVKKMISASKQNNVFLMEAMWGRLVPGTIKLIELVSSGALGDIMGAEGKFCYNMDDEPDHHIFMNAQGGGSLLDVGVYGLYFLRWYLGKNTTSVQALADIKNGVDTHLSVQMQYGNGGIGNFSSAVLLQKPNEGAIYGTKGYAKMHRFYAPTEIEINYKNGKSEKLLTPYKGNGFEEQIAHVCECINNGLTESPVNSFEESLFIAGQMDEIRSKIGLIYPQDSAK